MFDKDNLDTTRGDKFGVSHDANKDVQSRECFIEKHTRTYIYIIYMVN